MLLCRCRWRLIRDGDSITANLVVFPFWATEKRASCVCFPKSECLSPIYPPAGPFSPTTPVNTKVTGKHPREPRLTNLAPVKNAFGVLAVALVLPAVRERANEV